MMSPMTAVMVFMFYASPSINSLMEEGPLNARTTITMTRMSNMWERPPWVKAILDVPGAPRHQAPVHSAPAEQ